MSQYSKSNPFFAEIISRYVLNKTGSSKETYHLSLKIDSTALSYKVGDAIGIFPENDPEEVAQILDLLQLDGKTHLFDPRTNSEWTLEHFLLKKTNLNKVSSKLSFLLTGKKIEPSEAKTHDLLSLLQMYPAKKSFELDEFASYVAPMLPRLYSIASSPKKDPNQIDLLVATFDYEFAGRIKKGIGSTFLCRPTTKKVGIYVHPTEKFTLPEEKSKPIVMIGPGTGVAPFRGFLQEREERAPECTNWLFFGERQKNYDFYYADYFCSHKNLKLSTAFSRDQEQKRYVQHEMWEHKKELNAWIQAGAIIYICGDAKQMAKEVTQTLQAIFVEEQKLSEEDAKKALHLMRKTGQLLLDVY